MTNPTGTSMRRRNVTGLLLTLGALVAWVVLWRWAHLRGEHLNAIGIPMRLRAPPFIGVFKTRIGARTLIPVALGIALIVAAPFAIRRLSWRALLLASGAATFAWAISVAYVDGWRAGVLKGVLLKDDYLHDLGRVHNPLVFLQHFVADNPTYTTHVRAHPPGIPILLWCLDRIGLGGATPAALLFIAGGAAATVAVLIATKNVAGEEFARRAAPFVAVAPAALWIGTSGDALMAGFGAWAVALVVLATGRHDRRGDLLALSGGLLFGVAFMTSYGLVLLLAVPLAVAASRRRLRPLLLAGAAGGAFLGLVALGGFWWVDGVNATRRAYDLSVAKDRPFRDFLLFNAAAFSVALGPAIYVAFTRLRGKAWLLVGGALASVVIAAATGLSKGEVERIWLPFGVFVLAAGGALVPDDHRGAARSTRGWLLVQVALTIALESTVRFQW